MSWFGFIIQKNIRIKSTSKQNKKKTKTAMPLISFGGCILFSLFIVAHQLM